MKTEDVIKLVIEYLKSIDQVDFMVNDKEELMIIIGRSKDADI